LLGAVEGRACGDTDIGDVALLPDGGEDPGEPGHRILEQSGLANGERATHVYEPVERVSIYRTNTEIEN
jgi:hypothetical protein